MDLQLLFLKSRITGRVNQPRRLYHVFLYFLLLLLFATGAQKASATHAAGGYLSYQWLYGTTYRFTVTFYKDCGGATPAPTQMEIDVNSSCGTNYINAPQVPGTGQEIGYPCPNVTTCSGGTNPGYRKYVYQVDFTFNVACTDWVISFKPSVADNQVLGRNALITTLYTPLGNMYIQSRLDNINFPANNSVSFISDPILFVCAGQQAVFNIGATDPDGDSLTYQFTSAMQSAGVPVSYVFPLSATNPLYPGAGAVSINSSTGEITINTSVVQVGVIDILVSEYKNGVFKGSVIMDIQVIVQACNNNYPALTGVNGSSIYIDTVCPGTVINFPVYSSDPDAGQNLTMTWNNGIPFPASFNVTGSPNPTGTFTWATTTADTRSAPYIFTITIQDDACPMNGSQTRAYSIYVMGPTISIGPSNPVICPGTSVSLTASGASTYTWSPSTGLSATTGQTVSANPSTTTTYTVTGTDVRGCSNTATITVSNNPPPTIIINPVAPAICMGQPVPLTASGAATYTWSPAAGLSSVSGTTVSASPSVTSTYIVTGTTTGGCSNTSSVTVTVNPLPAITVNSPNSICHFQSVTLTAGGGISYTWAPATGLSSTTGSTVTASPASTTTYTVSGTGSNGCIGTKTVTVVLNPIPVILVTTPSPICSGQSTPITASGGVSYTWSPAAGLSATTGATVSASPSATTTYIVTGSNIYGCTATRSTIVTINPAPLITVNIPAPICNGQSDSLTASGASTYTWSPATGLSATTGSTVTANPALTTIYTVTGADAIGCTNTESVTVTISSPPVISVNTPLPFCIGQSATLTASGGSTYTWSPGTGLSATTGANVTANPSTTSTYIVTGTNAGGCSNTSSVTVTVKSLPVVNAGPDVNVCRGGSILLNLTGPLLGSTFSWTPSVDLSCVNCQNPTADPLDTTTYIVFVTDPNGCSSSDTIVVNVTPNFAIAGPDTLICSGSIVPLYASGGTTFRWSPSTGLTDSTIANPFAHPLASTTYTVTVSTGNCTATATVVVNTHPYLPTPVIVLRGDSLFCSTNPAYFKYQWYDSATLVPGAIDTFFVATHSGNYNVAVSDDNGCSISVGINIVLLPTGMEEQPGFGGSAFTIYPNPAGDIIKFTLNERQAAGNIVLTVYNVLGEKILSGQLMVDHTNDQSIDISKLSAGVYFIEIQEAQSKNRMVNTFVKE